MFLPAGLTVIFRLPWVQFAGLEGRGLSLARACQGPRPPADVPVPGPIVRRELPTPGGVTLVFRSVELRTTSVTTIATVIAFTERAPLGIGREATIACPSMGLKM